MWVAKRNLFRTGQIPQGWTVLILVLTAGMLYFFVFDTLAEVDLELVLPPGVTKSEVKIYYADEGEGFSEERMAVVSTSAGQSKYHLYLTDLAEVARLRLDPHTYKGEVVLKQLKISQNGFADVLLDSPETLSLLEPRHDIARMEQSGEGMRIVSSGSDPYLEFAHVFMKAERDWWILASGLSVSVCLVLLVWGTGQCLLREYLYIPVLLFGVWLLVLSMAALSRENAHPDEYVHLAAVQYYENHWLPPAIDRIESPHAYSCYGVSRLWDHDLYYFLAGKCSKVFQAFHLHVPFTERLGNVLLFFGIVLFSFRNISARLVAAPLLLSPQVWYLFSYCNSDAFALFMAWLSAWQFVDEKSMLNRLLWTENPLLQKCYWRDFLAGRCFPRLFSSSAVKMGIAGAVLGVLFLTKKNYVPFIVFLYAAFGVRIWFDSSKKFCKKSVIFRVAAITLIGCAVFGGRVGIDYAVNGIDLQARRARVRREMSLPAFRPEAPAPERHPGIGMKARGIHWKEAMFTDLWGEKSFQSFFGVFGYLSLYGSTLYYNLVRWSVFVLLGTFFAFYFYRSTLAGSLVAGSAVLLGAALIAVSFYHSWTMDFQPQGRYLMPILPMAGLLCGIQGPMLRRLPVVFPLGLLFSLSMYFFIFEGLQRIPKYLGG